MKSRASTLSAGDRLLSDNSDSSYRRSYESELEQVKEVVSCFRNTLFHVFNVCIFCYSFFMEWYEISE